MKKNLILLYFVLIAFLNTHAQDTTGVNRKDSLYKKDSSLNNTDDLGNNNSVSTYPSYKNAAVYKLNFKADLPVIIVGGGWSGYAFTKIYSKEPLAREEVLGLNVNSIPRFDRSATRHYNEKATQVANTLFHASMPLSLLMLFDNKMRKDFLKLETLYLEAMSVTGFFYTGSVYFADRYRPYAYNASVPVDYRMRPGSRNSFFAGHPALVGTSTFFLAKVYADYHPASKLKWLFYTIAGAATATTSVCRYLGGWHFPSDLLIGTSLGPLAGILVPALHKNKKHSEPTTVLPFAEFGTGLTVIHKL
jgi:membrane-associated phospholipid phosphatase